MSAVYNNKIVTKLTRLANNLADRKFLAEAGYIRSIIGKVLTWKADKEWNTYNALSSPDADNVLDDVINKFIITVDTVKKKDMAEKRKEMEAEENNEKELDSSSVEEAIKNLDSVLEDLF
jgi:hypothetical protein